MVFTPASDILAAHHNTAMRPHDATDESPSLVLFQQQEKTLTRDMSGVVSRSIEVRINEARASKKLKLKRPLNAFMLYKSTKYQYIVAWLLAQKACADGRAVSRTAAQWWKTEPQLIKNIYSGLAEIDRKNYRKAIAVYSSTESTKKNFDTQLAKAEDSFESKCRNSLDEGLSLPMSDFRGTDDAYMPTSEKSNISFQNDCDVRTKSVFPALRGPNQSCSY
ncbi:hypothetical protein N7486_001252 [Penicillium sp. IBT 16267x]|nr:hypothetical protein N7486_001252 [Penicillium sp. IBT 16267x]